MAKVQQTIHVHHPALLRIAEVTPFGDKVILDNLSSLAEERIEQDVIFPLPCPAKIRVTILTGKSYTFTIPIVGVPPEMPVEHLDDILDVEVPSPGDGYYLAWDQASGLWIAKAPTFLNLLDTPATYVGKAGQLLAVKAAEDGIEFIEAEAPSRVKTWLQTDGVTIPSGAWTKVPLNAEDYDNLDEFDTTTNYRFTAKSAGAYLLAATIRFVNTPANKIYFAGLFKNDQEIDSGGFQSSHQNYLSALVVDVALLNPNDYVELKAYQNSGGSVGIGAYHQTFMAIHKLS